MPDDSNFSDGKQKFSGSEAFGLEIFDTLKVCSKVSRVIAGPDRSDAAFGVIQSQDLLDEAAMRAINQCFDKTVRKYCKQRVICSTTFQTATFELVNADSN